MAGSKPQAWWDTIRRARLFRVLAVYLGTSFVVIQLVDIFTDQRDSFDEGCQSHVIDANPGTIS